MYTQKEKDIKKDTIKMRSNRWSSDIFLYVLVMTVEESLVVAVCYHCGRRPEGWEDWVGWECWLEPF